MRIGETADLSVDCLRHLSGDDWSLHVPLGKLHNDRPAPADEQVRTIVARLQFLRTLPGPEATLCAAASQAGSSAHIVPHQMRHTFAASMPRAGVSLPAPMKMLGHRTANMTLRYVEIAQKDLQREFHLARQSPRYLIPLPPSAAVADPDIVDAAAVAERLSSAIRVRELYRQQNSVPEKKQIELLYRRLVRVSRFPKLVSETKTEK